MTRSAHPTDAPLAGHLGADAGELDVVQEARAPYDHVNVQTALDVWLAEPGREHELVGIIGFQHRQFGLAELLVQASRRG